MKAKHCYLLAAMGAIMFASCSNDDVPQPGGENFEGEAVMNLSLKFAGNETKTKAWGEPGNPGDEDFKPGEGDESQINDVYVYYFNDDTDRKLIGSAKATFSTQTVVDGNIESKVEATVPAEVVQDLTADEKAHIIVVLNRPASFNPASNQAYATSFNNALTIEAGTNAGFMMTSTNYYEDSKENHFKTIDKTYIAKKGTKPTKEAEVYVERVCGKVQLSTAAPIKVEADATAEVLGWELNVRNKKLYPVKVLNEENPDGNKPFTQLLPAEWSGADNWNNDNAITRFRSYWAKDPNYNNADGHTPTTPTSYSENFTKINITDLESSIGSSLYCLENTFSHLHQRRNETTTAVVLATYFPKDITGTWVLANNHSYSVKLYVDNFLTGGAYTGTKIYAKVETANFVEANGDHFTLAATGTKVEKGDIVYGADSYELQAATGVTLCSDNSGTVLTPEELTQLKNDFATYMTGASVYYNGYCYYEIPVRHFNDTEVPLAGKPGAVGTNINDEGQLGRYGIVRNHWYQLTINKITQPGKPITTDPVDPENKPDDPTEEYAMNVTVKILKWAVRTQEVEL